MDINLVMQSSNAKGEAVWVDNLAGLPGARFLMRPWISLWVQREQARLERAASKEDRDADGKLTPEAALRIDKDVVASHVLLGWDGLDQGGEPLEFSHGLARQLLDFEDFFLAVALARNDATSAAADKLDALRKNSSPPSSDNLAAEPLATSSPVRKTG